MSCDSGFQNTPLGLIPNHWGISTLDEIADVKGRIGWRGYTVDDLRDNGPLVLGAKDISKGNILDLSSAKHISREKYLESPDIVVERGDILVVKVGNTIGKVAIVLEDLGEACINPNTVLIKRASINSRFLYYHLIGSYAQEYLISNSAASAQPAINQSTIKKMLIPLPKKSEIDSISNILSSLDDKIELNNRMNKILEEIAQTIFKHWFVDFEFPDENGNPYKSSGGKMVESELGMIPDGWEASSLSSIIVNYDSKRVPLSSREREKLDKIYPYYGAASQMDYVDRYLFDGIYVLMGEDGTVITDNGTPMLQYVWGKFWVNNHAHILQGKRFISTEYVYLLLRQTNIVHIVTGAVQPKITQKNMNELPAVVPSMDIAYLFKKQTTSLFGLLRSVSDEIKHLTQIRDTLLPKLMSGEIRVPIAEE